MCNDFSSFTFFSSGLYYSTRGFIVITTSRHFFSFSILNYVSPVAYPCSFQILYNHIHPRDLFPVGFRNIVALIVFTHYKPKPFYPLISYNWGYPCLLQQLSDELFSPHIRANYLILPHISSAKFHFQQYLVFALLYS